MEPRKTDVQNDVFIRAMSPLARHLATNSIHIFAFCLKELKIVLSQRLLLGSLILGPFLILLGFGITFSGRQPDLTTLLVVPSDPQVNRWVSRYEQQFTPGFRLVGVIQDQRLARDQLLAGQVDVVVIVPSSITDQLASGNRVRLQLIHNLVDPFERDWLGYSSYLFFSELNRQILTELATAGRTPLRSIDEELSSLIPEMQQLESTLDVDTSEARGQIQRMVGGVNRAEDALAEVRGLVLAAALSAGEDSPEKGLQELDELRQGLEEIAEELKEIDRLLEAGEVASADLKEQLSRLSLQIEQTRSLTQRLDVIPPDVLVTPFEAEVINLANPQPSYVGYYAPGVLALLIQHLGMTLAALSLVRERLIGSMEIFRVAPISAVEMLAGYTLAYALVILGLGGLLIVVMRFWLGVPAFGPLGWLAATLIVLTITSLGIGFAVSAESRSEQQAVQLTTLILLASVFFSGFFLPLSMFEPVADVISRMLPVTHGIVMLQSLLLRNQHPEILPLATCLGLATVTFAWAGVRLHFQLKLD